MVDSEARTSTIACDRSRVTATTAQQAGVDEFQAELLAEEKVRAIKSLGKIGPMAMVGQRITRRPSPPHRWASPLENVKRMEDSPEPGGHTGCLQCLWFACVRTVKSDRIR